MEMPAPKIIIDVNEELSCDVHGDGQTVVPLYYIECAEGMNDEPWEPLIFAGRREEIRVVGQILPSSPTGLTMAEFEAAITIKPRNKHHELVKHQHALLDAIIRNLMSNLNPFSGISEDEAEKLLKSPDETPMPPLLLFKLTKRQQSYEGKPQVRLGHDPLYFFPSPPSDEFLKKHAIRAKVERAITEDSHSQHPCC
jgi:hypothetical protein